MITKTNDHVSTTNIIRILQYELLSCMFLNIEIYYYSFLANMCIRHEFTDTCRLHNFGALRLRAAVVVSVRVHSSQSGLGGRARTVLFN